MGFHSLRNGWYFPLSRIDAVRMKPDFEPPRPPTRATSFAAFERSAPRFDFHWHYHPELELTYIVDSRGERLVGDHVAPYHAGELVFLGPNLPHTWTSAGSPHGAPHRAIVIQFRPEVVPAPLLQLREFNAVAGLIRRSARGLRFRTGGLGSIERTLRTLMRQRDLDGWIALLRLLAQLAEVPAQPLASSGFTPQLPLARQAQLQRALAYIDAHNEPDLALPRVAQAAGVSPATLVRLFRRMLGRSFVGYVTDLRIAHVCRELIGTEKGVAEIAYANGFNNLANFNRQFRALKRTTPSAFRRRFSAPGGAR